MWCWSWFYIFWHGVDCYENLGNTVDGQHIQTLQHNLYWTPRPQTLGVWLFPPLEPTHLSSHWTLGVKGFYWIERVSICHPSTVAMMDSSQMFSYSKVQASCHATVPIPPAVHQCPEIYTFAEFGFLPRSIPAHFSFLPISASYLRFLEGACLQICCKKYHPLNFVPPFHEFIWLSDAYIQWHSPTLSSVS